MYLRHNLGKSYRFNENALAHTAGRKGGYMNRSEKVIMYISILTLVAAVVYLTRF